MPPDEMVTLDVDDALKSPGSGAPYLHLPRFVNFQEQGFHWRIYDDPIISSGHVKLRALARPGRFILQARPTDQGAVVRLVNTESGQTLYEQQLRTTSRGRYPRHCPYDTSQWRGLKKGYDTAVLRAVGQEPRESIPSKVLAPEVARSACSLGGADVDGLRGLRAWDGRLVVLYPESVRTRVGFCSDTYIALVYVSIRSPDPMDLSPAVQLFNRKTMEPIASFNDRRPCLRGRCEEAPKAIVKGVRIENNSVVVETDRGDLQASRLLR